MMIDVVVRGVDEVKLLCSWCKVVVMYEVVVNYVRCFDCLIKQQLVTSVYYCIDERE